ncbi:MAG: hypothetical protein ACI8YP_001976, partial [Algoriphagus sp.]
GYLANTDREKENASVKFLHRRLDPNIIIARK